MVTAKKVTAKPAKAVAKSISINKKVGIFAIIGGAIAALILLFVGIAGLSSGQTAINSDNDGVLGFGTSLSVSSLPAPTGFTLTSRDGYMDLHWNSVSGNNGYKIYRKSAWWVPFYSLVHTSGQDTVGFGEGDTSSGLIIGKTYYYKVAAFKYDSNGKVVIGKKTSSRSAKLIN